MDIRQTFAIELVSLNTYWHTEGRPLSSNQLLWLAWWYFWRWPLAIQPVTLTNTDDKANYHIREERRLRPTDSSTSLSHTATIEDDLISCINKWTISNRYLSGMFSQLVHRHRRWIDWGQVFLELCQHQTREIEDTRGETPNCKLPLASPRSLV